MTNSGQTKHLPTLIQYTNDMTNIRSDDQLPKMVSDAMSRVHRGTSYLSAEQRHIFDGYEGPVVTGDPDYPYLKGNTMQDAPEALFEVMPAQEVKEKTLQTNYYTEHQREIAELNGFYPVDPSASSGVALKVIREIVV